MLLQKQRTVCIKVYVIQSSGPLSDSTVLDETWVLARAGNKPLYAFALLWTSYSLSFGDSDSGHNKMDTWEERRESEGLKLQMRGAPNHRESWREPQGAASSSQSRGEVENA